MGSDNSQVIKVSTQQEFRTYLKERLRAKGVTLKSLADKSGLYASTVQRFVTQEGTISFEKACDLIDKACGGYIALPSVDGYLVKEEVIELREKVKSLEFKLKTQEELLENYKLMVRILNSKMDSTPLEGAIVQKQLPTAE